MAYANQPVMHEEVEDKRTQLEDKRVNGWRYSNGAVVPIWSKIIEITKNRNHLEQI